MRMQKYAKSCCHKTTWAIILMTPIHLLEASGVPAFTLQQGGWITVASFPGSPLAPTKNINGGGEPGTDSHVISRHDDFALTIK